MSESRLFVIENSYEAEVRWRDEFGWIEGQGPGNGRYEPRQATLRIVAPNRDWAENWARHWFSGGGIRNHQITETKQHRIDAIIQVSQP